MPSENTHDERLCRRCGRCCYAKLIIEEEVYYTDIPCAFLDVETKLCTIYEHRFRLNPECLSVEKGIELGVFPADCPYVKNLPRYKPPHTDCDFEEMSRIYNEED